GATTGSRSVGSESTDLERVVVVRPGRVPDGCGGVGVGEFPVDVGLWASGRFGHEDRVRGAIGNLDDSGLAAERPKRAGISARSRGNAAVGDEVIPKSVAGGAG